MSKPTGKLKFAYDTIMAFEECIAELEAEITQLRAELGGRPTQWAYEQVCKADEEQRTEIAQLLLQLYEVREIYTGSDGFIPETAPEAYCLRVMEQMYQAALTEGET